MKKGKKSVKRTMLKGRTNISSKKPKIPKTKIFSCLSSPLILDLECFDTTTYKFNSELRNKQILVVGIWGFMELVFTFPFINFLNCVICGCPFCPLMKKVSLLYCICQSGSVLSVLWMHFCKNKQQFSTCILLDDMTFVNECKSTQLGYIQSCDY